MVNFSFWVFYCFFDLVLFFILICFSYLYYFSFLIMTTNFFYSRSYILTPHNSFFLLFILKFFSNIVFIFLSFHYTCYIWLLHNSMCYLDHLYIRLYKSKNYAIRRLKQDFNWSYFSYTLTVICNINFINSVNNHNAANI